MSPKRKLLILPAVILVSLIFAGCGQKTENKEDVAFPETGFQEEKADLPEPTGKVSDTVNAITKEAEGEKNIISLEENEAQNVAAEDQEAKDFGNIYDENEL